jgi:ATP-binding protein involved in chromosome partitioning
VTMTLAQLLPHSKFVIVTTPQEAAQKVARRAAETALRYDIEVLGVVENMYGEVFGEGGGQLLADDLDVPLLGKIPLTEELRRASDAGRPLVLDDPDNPAAQALFHTARGIIAAAPPEIAALATPIPATISGTPLPMAG